MERRSNLRICSISSFILLMFTNIAQLCYLMIHRSYVRNMGDSNLLDTIEFLRKSGNEIPKQVWENVENAIFKRLFLNWQLVMKGRAKNPILKHWKEIIEFDTHSCNLRCDEFHANQRLIKIVLCIYFCCAEDTQLTRNGQGEKSL
jgi:hypothetical protein